MIRFYFDVHVPSAIVSASRRREIDVLTARENSRKRLADADLLLRATGLERVVFTQDIRFKALAQEWQRTGRAFGGPILGHQLHGSIGQYVRDLELISGASDLRDWRDHVEQLPWR